MKSQIINQQKWWFDNTKVVLIFCFISILFYSFYYFNKINFPDRAYLGGDTWEYQSIAVNYAKGHGFPIFGSKEPFLTYKMTWALNKGEFLTNYTNFMKAKGSYNFYRTPAFPLFLGVIYKIYGISPAKAKQVQLFMLILVASFLPYIGYHYWKIQGFFSGLPAGILFINKYYLIAISYELLTEPLIIFSLFLLALTFLLHEKKGNIISSLLLGIMMGLCLLVKGSLIFIPPLFLAYFIYRIIKKEEKVVNVSAFLIAIIITVLPWSLYATQKAGKPIILSTQTNNVMLECNYESSFKDGIWRPIDTDDPDVFYNKAEIKNLPLTYKLSLFYYKNYDKIPVVIYNKLVAGFEELIFLKMAIILVIFEVLQIPTKQYLGKFNQWVSLILRCLLLGGIILLGLAYFKIVPLLCILIIALSILIMTKKWQMITIPVQFLLFFLNFLFLTLLTCGITRYTSVIDFIIILTSIRYIWYTAMSLVSPIMKVNVV